MGKTIPSKDKSLKDLIFFEWAKLFQTPSFGEWALYYLSLLEIVLDQLVIFSFNHFHTFGSDRKWGGEE
jgi:hypothetical protein